MTCIIDSLFYNLLVHVCLFHALYCEVVNSGDGGVRGVNNNFHLMKGGNTYFFNAQGGKEFVSKGLYCILPYDHLKMLTSKIEVEDKAKDKVKIEVRST